MIALTLLSLETYSQSKPQITIKVIDNDTVFLFNRDYAKYIISRFDSLEHYKDAFFTCVKLIDDCNAVKNQYKELSNLKEQEIISLNRQIRYCDELAESQNRTDIINKALQKDLKRQNRKLKIWNGIGWGAITTTVITSAILIFK